jgi:hypothetical protein
VDTRSGRADPCAPSAAGPGFPPTKSAGRHATPTLFCPSLARRTHANPLEPLHALPIG